jgi:hypothetical protein
LGFEEKMLDAAEMQICIRLFDLLAWREANKTSYQSGEVRLVY